MNTRILHCSTSLGNYYACIEHKVSGFTNRESSPGDHIYLVVKIDNVTYCGARFTLDQETDFKPWADAERYVHVLSIKELEFCKPFDISIISEQGGKYWSIKYLIGSKAIKEAEVVNLLDKTFAQNKTNEMYQFPQSGEMYHCSHSSPKAKPC